MQEISWKTDDKQSFHAGFFLGLFFHPKNGGDKILLNVR
jgi:hypothetical protein